MSVQPGPTFKRYAANGVAKVYAIPFLLLDAADLQVTLNGVLVTTGFVLSGIGSATSACTFSVAPTGDLLFQQVMVFQRLSDYQMNGDLLSTTVNRDYDRLWLAIKQVSRDSGRALTVSELEPEGIPSLPAKEFRALKVLAFDGFGVPVTSSMTLDQLEQQPSLAADAAAMAQDWAEQAQDAALSAYRWSSYPEDTPVIPGVFSALHWAAKSKASALAAAISASFAGDPWNFQPVGVPIPIFDHLTGITPPPTDKSYRYIKLTASDSYNTGALTRESISGSSPNVIATAVIALAGSPLYGQSINLINTMRRVLKSGSSGVLEADLLGPMLYAQSTATGAGNVYTSNVAGAGAVMSRRAETQTTPVGVAADGTTWITNTGAETRVKSIGATYYMRIK